MTISLIKQGNFPFGRNIQFAYDIEEKHLIYLDPSLEWLRDARPEDPVQIQELYEKLMSDNFYGNAKVKLSVTEGFRWLSVTPFLGESDNKKVITGTAVEITDEMTSYELLTKFADKKNSVLHMLGHDLRGPLNIARTLMETIRPEMDAADITGRTGYISNILQQSIDLISDLVTREFLETTNAELTLQRVEIVSKIQDYIAECRRSESMSGLNFQIRSSSEKIYLSLDIAKFMQVINNLISNALKFTPPGGLISVSLEDHPDQVELRFSDTGIGIPESLLPQVFEKFTTAGRKGLQGQPTIGLGLSIVKTIIGWHHGKITCESTEGAGTTFFIVLPKH